MDILVNNEEAPSMTTDLRIIENKILGGWFVVRGAHHTPISGRFDTKREALASLRDSRQRDRADAAALEDFNYVGSRHHY